MLNMGFKRKRTAGAGQGNLLLLLARRGLLGLVFFAGIGSASWAQPVPRSPSAFPPANVAPPLLAPAPGTPGAAATPRAPLADRLPTIRSRGELLVCIWPEYFAISYRNPRNGELEGIDIDLARALAARLNVRLTFVETNFAEFMDRLEEGACDIAMMGVGITAARAQRVAFTKPYLASSVYAVTTRTNTRMQSWRDIDSPGTVVAVAAGTVMEPLMRETLRNAELMVVNPPRTREGEILSGRADVFMSDFPYTRRMVLMHDWARVIDPPGRFGETLYAYAVPRGDPAWLAEVNAFLERTRVDGTLARTAQRHGLTPILLP
jgi:ABC-type amino acid transport substrate-binding protein